MTISATALKQLQAAVGENHVHTEQEKLMVYSFDGTFQNHKPEVLVKPHTTAEVADVVKIAAAHRFR